MGNRICIKKTETTKKKNCKHLSESEKQLVTLGVPLRYVHLDDSKTFKFSKMKFRFFKKSKMYNLKTISAKKQVVQQDKISLANSIFLELLSDVRLYKSNKSGSINV